MIGMPTSNATELGLRYPTALVHDAARGACLGRVGRLHFDKLAAGPCELVAEHLREAAPCRARDASRWPVGPSYHVLGTELFENDRAVALGVGRTQIVQDMLTLSPDLAMQARNAQFGFLPVLRSFLASCDDALGMSDLSERAIVEGGIRHEAPVAVRDEVHDAAIDGHNGLGAGCRFGQLDLADDQREPLTRLASKRAGLRPALKRPMCDDAHVSELRETKHGAIQTPALRVWLAERNRIATPSLPTRRTRELLEATPPSLVEIHKQMRTDVSRHVGDPRNVGAKLCQLVDLVERGREDPVGPWPGKANQSLLVREVPEEPERTLPIAQAPFLRRRWVEPEAVAATDQQRPKRNHDLCDRNRRRRWLRG